MSQNKYQVLVIGGNGFVGNHIIRYLSKHNINVLSVVRNKLRKVNKVEYVPVGNFTNLSFKNWYAIFKSVDCVIDCSGKNPVKDFRESDLMDVQRLTENVTKALVSAKVKHYIFLSSVKVLGENTEFSGFNNSSRPNPNDLYGQSKTLSEKIIEENLRGSDTKYTIFRPPLIIGKDVKGNLISLISLIDKKVPLPIKDITNKRAIIGVSNLANYVCLSIMNENFFQKKLLVFDANLSTYDLGRKIASSLNKKNNFFKVPNFIIKFLVAINPKFNKIFNSLEIDPKTMTIDTKLEQRYKIDYDIGNAVKGYLSNL